jgi:fused signal recognition particle receptor
VFKQLFGSKPKEAEPAAPQQEEAGGLQKFRNAMSLTGQALVGRILSFGRTDNEPFTEDDLDEIEETLIRADMGVDMAVAITEKIRKNPACHQRDHLADFLRKELSSLLNFPPSAYEFHLQPGVLNILLVVGVNGAGKTTLIGKVANKFRSTGQKVVIAAGDVFRAAAEDQLAVWAERAQVPLVRKDNGDAAAVVFDALQLVKSQETDILIVDTAGRLQNKFNLMEELSKIKKVIEKEAPPGARLETLLVLDATTGQNALSQAKVFHDAVDLTGIALTKLDGSAKGGVIFKLAQDFKLPVKLVGVGEKIEDLEPFEPHRFIDALFATAAK